MNYGTRLIVELRKDENFHDYKLKKIEILHGKYGYVDPVKVSLIICNELMEWQIQEVSKYRGF